MSCYSYASAFSTPMLISIKINHVNLKFLLPTINVCCHVNLKVQQSCQHSCQIQAPAVMSIKVNSFFKYNLFLLTAKWLVRIQEQLVPANLFLLSVKQQVHIQEQLVPFLLVSAERQVRIQEQLVPLLFLVSQVTSSNSRTACA